MYGLYLHVCMHVCFSREAKHGTHPTRYVYGIMTAHLSSASKLSSRLPLYGTRVNEPAPPTNGLPNVTRDSRHKQRTLASTRHEPNEFFGAFFQDRSQIDAITYYTIACGEGEQRVVRTNNKISFVFIVVFTSGTYVPCTPVRAEKNHGQIKKGAGGGDEEIQHTFLSCYCCCCCCYLNSNQGTRKNTLVLF